MNILVFIDQYSRGGAARVTSTMLKGLCDQGYHVTLATNIITDKIGYPLDSRVKVISFYGGKSNNKIESLIKYNRLIAAAHRCIKQTKPNVIITVMHGTYLFVRIASWFSNIPLIAVDHTSFSRKISWWEDWVRHSFYKYADTLSILTKKDESLLGEKFPNKVVIYNPLSFPILDKETQRKKNILVAGRLSYWKVKGIDRIIEIWNKLSNSYPDWTLEIAGDGDEKSIAYLKELASNNNSIVFLGQLSDMKTKLSETSIFALPSRIEGFPMVLMEAMSQGCACVTFSLGGACNEMLTDNHSGLIVKDDSLEDFHNSLKRLLDDSALRKELSKNAINESKRFSTDKFNSKWDCIIKKYINNK